MIATLNEFDMMLCVHVECRHTGSYRMPYSSIFAPIWEMTVSWEPKAAFMRIKQHNVSRWYGRLMKLKCNNEKYNKRKRKKKWTKFITSERRYFAYSVEWIAKLSTCYPSTRFIIPSIGIEKCMTERFIVSESNIRNNN